MNPETPHNPREELEAKVTALLLGELDANEAEIVRRAIEANPELGRLQERLKQTIDLVAAASTDLSEASDSSETLRLTDTKREALLAHFKTIKPLIPRKPAPRRRSITLIEIAALLAILCLLGAMFLPALSRSKGRASRFLVQSSLRELEAAKQLSAAEQGKTTDSVRTQVDLDAYLGYQPGSAEGGTYELGTVVEQTSVSEESETRYFTFTPAGQAVNGRKLYRYSALDSEDASLASATPTPGQSLTRPQPAPGTFVATDPTPRGQTAAGRGPRKVDIALPELASNESEPQASSRRWGDQTVSFGGSLADVERGLSLAERETATPDFQRPTVLNGVETAGTEKYLWGFGEDTGMGEEMPQLATGREGDDDNSEQGPRKTLIEGHLLESNPQSPPVTLESGLIDSTMSGGVFESGSGSTAAADEFLFKNGGYGDVDNDGNMDLLASAYEQPIAGAGGRAGALDSANTAAGIQLGVSLSDTPARRSEERRSEQSTPFFASVYSRAESPTQVEDSLERFAALDGVESAPHPGLQLARSAASRDRVLAEGVATVRQDDTFGLDASSLAVGDLVDSEGRERTAGFGFYDVSGGALADNPSSQGGRSPTTSASTRGRGGALGDTTRGYQARDGKVEAADETADVEWFVPPSDGAAKGTLATAASQPGVDHGALEVKEAELSQLRALRDSVAKMIQPERSDVALPQTAIVTAVDKVQVSEPAAGGLSQGKDARATARVRAAEDQADITQLGRWSVGVSDPNAVRSEEETIRSPEVLALALSKLKGSEELTDAPNPDEIRELQRRIKLRPVDNTSLVEITAESANPQEAADISTAVAEAYQEYRMKQSPELAMGDLRTLGRQYARLEERIAAKEEEVEQLRAVRVQSTPKEEDPVVAQPPAPAPVPQPEVRTTEHPFSTFSLNVSDVSFKLAAASLEQGQLPAPASIRTEEFINAFDYHDPAAAAGQPLAFAWERARYPFAHNRDLLRFSVQTAAQGREDGRPLNLVLLLDNSGSMERADRVSIIRECLHVLSAQLTAEDTISVVSFARTPRLWLDGITGAQAAQSFKTIAKLPPEGGTNLEEAMHVAYATAERHYLNSGINRVVLLTDGAANLGDVDPDSLKATVEARRHQGIALDCFGIGWEGYNDDLLEVLSRNGDGRYGFVNTPQEAAGEFADQLAGALQVAASDVKVQVEFNPKRTTAYRQIGYAKHQLTKEQFRDNTVDAAEIGSAESGNALYVIETDPRGTGPIGIVRARFKVPATGEYREYEWTVPYTGQSESLDRASAAIRLAASASAFSEWLASSPYAGDVTPDQLLRLMEGVPEVFGADSRPTQLKEMIRQAGRIAGR